MRSVEKRGDTLIEVMLSISIFALVALLTINLMNDGLNTAQRTLEAAMARNEIDGQAEALRYIHNNYVAERNMDTSQFRKAWQTITKNSMPASMIGDGFDINNMESCEDPYANNGHLSSYKAFVVNPRLLIPNNYSDNKNSAGIVVKDMSYLGKKYNELLDHMLVYYSSDNQKLFAPSLYPRIIYKELKSSSSGKTDDGNLSDRGVIYNDISRAEGIWVSAVGNAQNKINVKRSDYYDFYIRTCWHSAGSKSASTITTVVRLYNPEVME